jgi:chemotaxis signal transduction protein
VKPAALAHLDAVQLLEARARQLARPASPEAEAATLEVIAFALAGEPYGVESRYVMAVSPLLHLTPLPRAEPPIHGVTGWRGELLTVLDLRRAAGLPVTALEDLNRVVVLGESRAAFGLLVDGVRGVCALPLSGIHPVPPGPVQARPYLLGITDDAMLVLDARTLLREWSEIL